MSVVLAVDGSSIFMRALHVLPREKRSDDDLEYNVVGMIRKAVNFTKADYLIVMLDSLDPLERLALHPGYKGTRVHRDLTPKQLTPMLMPRLLKRGIEQLIAPGYEADDLLYSMARKVKPSGELYLYTKDSDLYGALHPDRPNVKILWPGTEGKLSVFDYAEVRDLLKYPPEWRPDIRALTADTKDNLRGIFGDPPPPRCAINAPRAAWMLEQHGGDILALLEQASAGAMEGLRDSEQQWISEHLDAILNARNIAGFREIPFELSPASCRTGLAKLDTPSRADREAMREAEDEAIQDQAEEREEGEDSPGEPVLGGGRVSGLDREVRPLHLVHEADAGGDGSGAHEGSESGRGSGDDPASLPDLSPVAGGEPEGVRVEDPGEVPGESAGVRSEPSGLLPDGRAVILLGDCRERMAEMEADSVDAIVTDPPYELGFMGKKWDASGVAFNPATWREAFRVLRPGGHLLAFGGTRTYHRMAVAIEDAGFEIRDQLQWLYGTGFPKSLDVSKAIDKAERGVPQGGVDPTSPNHGKYKTQATEGARGEGDAGRGYGAGPGQYMREAGVKAELELCGAARQWKGWGTALKPANEPVCLARKPLIGTVAENVQAHGTGALNIDGCRIESGERPLRSNEESASGLTGTGGAVTYGSYAVRGSKAVGVTTDGRWPANVILDEEAAAMLDAQSGESRSVRSDTPQPIKTSKGVKGGSFGNAEARRPDGHETHGEYVRGGYTDSGGASRFFYVAKAGKRERGEGNAHPTVKPVALMRYLVRLITPPGGLVLDPFLGSGTTGIAALEEGFRFVGIEMSEEYIAIAERRILAATEGD